MTWTKLSDDFSDDCWTLSDAAFRLHVEALVWSNRKLLDLGLNKDELRRWAKHPEAAEELVAAGYWRDAGDRFVIVHHGLYQRTREQVQRQQDANRRNRRSAKHPRPGREIRTANDSSDDSSNESLNEKDRTGQDGPGQQKRPPSGTDDPHCLEEIEHPGMRNNGQQAWHGAGPSPFEEYR